MCDKGKQQQIYRNGDGKQCFCVRINDDDDVLM